MKFALTASILALLSGSALAYEADNQSMGSASKSSNFSDPDDKTPLYMSGSGKGSSDSQDQSSMHYEYDSQSGVYVPVTTKK